MILSLSVSVATKMVIGIVFFLLVGYFSFKITIKMFSELEKIKGYENFISLILFYVVMMLMVSYPVPYLRRIASNAGVAANFLPLLLIGIVILVGLYFFIMPLSVGIFTIYVKKLSYKNEDDKPVFVLVSLLFLLAVLFLLMKISPMFWDFIGIY